MERLRADDPRQMGPYRLEARLGAGGMGRVYLGFSPAGRAVAVKVIHPELAHDQAFLVRFRREVAAARQVGGIYTAPVVDAGDEEDPPWLATGYIAGPSLADVAAAQGPLAEESVWRLGAGLVEALAAIHACRLVHRDLKPSNVLLALDGPRVIDFGISRALEATTATTTGVIVGTPAFMSPEQAEGHPAGPASDVFSLGCVLAFAASGAGPFGAGTPATILYRIVHAQPAVDRIPVPLRRLVTDCLAKSPADRPTLTQLMKTISAHPLPAAETSAVSYWPATLANFIDSRARLATTPATSPPPESANAQNSPPTHEPTELAEAPSPDGHDLPSTMTAGRARPVQPQELPPSIADPGSHRPPPHSYPASGPSDVHGPRPARRLAVIGAAGLALATATAVIIAITASGGAPTSSAPRSASSPSAARTPPTIRTGFTTSGGLTGVAVVSADSAWAVGYNKPSITPLIARWDGTVWKQVASPNPPTGGQLSAVAASSATNAWAVGFDNGSPGNGLIEHWDGTSWKLVPSPSFRGGAILTSVAAFGTHAWAVGYRNPSSSLKTLTEYWNGTAWKQVPNPAISGPLHVAATSATSAWAVGAAPSSALILHWNGSAWKRVASPVGGYLAAVTATSPTNVWAVGTANGKTLIVHWDGTAWKHVPSPTPAGGGSLTGVAATSATSAWAVGHIGTKYYGKALILHWDGTSWKQVPSPADVLWDVAAPSAASAWAVGGTGGPDNPNEQTLILHWGGTTWR